MTKNERINQLKTLGYTKEILAKWIEKEIRAIDRLTKKLVKGKFEAWESREYLDNRITFRFQRKQSFITWLKELESEVFN